MSNFLTNSNNRKSTTVIFMFVLLFMFSFSAFSQSAPSNSIADSNVNEVRNNVKLESSRDASNMEFVLWFMGSKQDPNSTISTEGINTKKQIMSSGITPNRVLIKAFLKKAVNYEIALS
jgi:hypothetical protein